jgi:hypothetical protein
MTVPNTTPPPAADPAAPPTPPPGATPGAQDVPPPASWEEVFNHPRFRELNKRAKEAEAQLSKLADEQKKADDKQAAEQGKWQQLAEQREAELKAEKLARTRLEIAAKKGIPTDLAGRLQGDTPEALEKDADALLAFLKPPTGPGVPPAGRGGAAKPLDLSNMTAEQVRKAMEGKSVNEALEAAG